MIADAETENALVAACVFQPDLFHSASEHIHGTDFVDEVNRALFVAVGSLHSEGTTPDQVLIRDRTLAMNAGRPPSPQLLDAKLASLRSCRFHAPNIGKYAEKLRRLSMLRSLQDSLQQLLSGITTEASPDELAGKAMEQILRTSARTIADDTLHYSELHRRYVASVLADVQVLEDTGILPGLRFGFDPIDLYTLGLRPEDLMILAGDPGSGKTSIVMSLLRRFALRELRKAAEGHDPTGALFVSLEMGEEMTGMRWAQMIGGLTTVELRDSPSRRAMEHLHGAWSKEDEVPLWILFGARMGADELKGRIAYMVKKYGVKLVVIDHFRKIKVDPRLGDNAADEARISFVKSEICKALGVSVILIAHTVKMASEREDKKPRLSDLRGSQMISAEADFITFVFRPWETLTQTQREDGNCPWKPTDAYFVWRKNRSARQNDSAFLFDGSTMRIEDPNNYGAPAVHVPVAPTPAQGQLVGGEPF